MAATHHRDREQQLGALSLANAVRHRIHLAKCDLYEGRRAIWDVIADAGPELASAPVLDLITAVRGLGRVKAERLMAGVPVSHDVRLGQMTRKQRKRLAQALQTQDWRRRVRRGEL